MPVTAGIFNLKLFLDNFRKSVCLEMKGGMNRNAE